MNNKFVTWIVATLKEAAWAPLAVFGFYVFGLLIHLFDNFPYMDIPTHFMGGVVITYFYRIAIRNIQPLVGEIPHPVRIIFAFTCTGTTTVFWEFYENFDRGRGFAPPATAEAGPFPAAEAHFGLDIMRERAQAAGEP